jgi:hypothetical protein
MSRRHIDNGGLQWTQTRLSNPRGLVFMPPLIGGGPAQQFNYFRWLYKLGLDLFSFNYTGHGRSTGKFSLSATIEDTRRMLSLAAGQAESKGIPLYGIAACYATIPMLYGALTSGEPFKKTVLINPLTALYPGMFLHALYCRCKDNFDLKTPARSLIKAIDSYLQALFPNVTCSSAGFGSLSRERTRIFSVLIEWLFSSLKLDFSLSQTPALCIYSRRDPILNLGGGKLKTANMHGIRRVCSPVTFHAIDSDHYLSDPMSRAATRQAIRTFLLNE